MDRDFRLLMNSSMRLKSGWSLEETVRTILFYRRWKTPQDRYGLCIEWQRRWLSRKKGLVSRNFLNVPGVGDWCRKRLISQPDLAILMLIDTNRCECEERARLIYDKPDQVGASVSVASSISDINDSFYRATAKHMHGLAIDILPVCLSVRLSKAWIVTKHDNCL